MSQDDVEQRTLSLWNDQQPEYTLVSPPSSSNSSPNTHNTRKVILRTRATQWRHRRIVKMSVTTRRSMWWRHRANIVQKFRHKWMRTISRSELLITSDTSPLLARVACLQVRDQISWHRINLTISAWILRTNMAKMILLARSGNVLNFSPYFLPTESFLALVIASTRSRGNNLLINSHSIVSVHWIVGQLNCWQMVDSPHAALTWRCAREAGRNHLLW